MGLNSLSYSLPKFGEACIPVSSSLAPLALILSIILSRLARTAAAYAPDAVVLDPPDLVADIIARLERAHDLLGGSR